MTSSNGKLIVVGTPIGNRGDLSPRAEEALQGADTVCAEDTRVTGRLLSMLGIDAHLERCDENVIASRAPQLVERIAGGETIAFCSDAGMPAVSDPGAVLVDACREAGLPVEVVPGPTAVATAIAASGFATTAFYFGGFLPRKSSERQRLLEGLSGLDACLAFYESPHRTAAALADIAQVLPSRQVSLCRELTKLHEEVLRGPASQVAHQVAERGDLKGEVVLVVGPPAAGEGRVDPKGPEARARAQELLDSGMSPSRAAKALAAELGVSKNAVYDLFH
ncbi:MAG: 16S rRNA (cytidine(1402)-2'-O)-methyltransferase [Coriobacteriales bacterium]|nr:16S rRNA (cytidine(1402)-2'-O)-methyltransferase [Coriobacteriales bacterium]